MRVVTLLAIGSLALAPSLAWADDTHLRVAGRIGAVPVIVAFLIPAESSPPQSGGQTQNDGNQQVGNHTKASSAARTTVVMQRIKIGQS